MLKTGERRLTGRIVWQVAPSDRATLWAGVCSCLARFHVCDLRESVDFRRADVGLRGAIVNDVVVVDVHQHGDGLADDERHPHGGVSVDSVQVAAHEERQGDLRGEKGTLQRRGCEGRLGKRGRGDVTHLSHHSHEGPEPEHPQGNAHQELDNKENRVR